MNGDKSRPNPSGNCYPTPSERWQKGCLGYIRPCCFVALAGSAFAYTALDYFKSAKQVYLEAETKGMVDLTKDLQKAYDGYENKYIKPYLENTVHSKIESSADLSGIVPPDPTTAILMDVLRNSKIVVDTSQDVKNQQQYSKVDLAVGGNNLIGLEYLSDKNKLAIAIPAFYNKYVYADLKDREKIQTRFGIFVEGETKIKAREITLTLSESQFKELLKKFAGKIQTDEKLLDLIYNKQKAWIKLMEDSGNSLEAQGIKEKSKDGVKASLKQFNQDLDKNLQQLKMPAGVKMTLLVDYAYPASF